MPEHTERTDSQETNESPKIKYTHLVVDENAFDPSVYQELDQKAQRVNRVAELTFLFHEWATTAPNISGIPDPDQFKQKVMETNEVIKKLLAVAVKFRSDEIVTKEETDELARSLGVSSWQDSAEEVKINSPYQIADLEAKGTVDQIIVHDIVNPANTMTGALDILTQFGKNDSVENLYQRGVTKAIGNTVDCLNLIEDPYVREEVRIDAVIKKLADSLRVAGISPETRIHLASGEKVLWSEIWLASLGTNLAQNIEKAYQTTRDDRPKVAYIDTQLVEENNQLFVKVSVEDRGPGLPPDFSNFKPGYTKWKDESVQKISTGMGMYSHLVALEKYGGNLQARNVMDDDGRVVGARVEFMIPVSGARPVTINP